MPLHNSTVISVSLLAAPVFGLGLGVSALRNKQKRPYGVKDDPTDALTKFHVAQRNAAEYAGVLIPLILLVDARSSRLLVGNGLRTLAEWSILGAAVSRTILVASLASCRSLADVNLGRLVGAWGTYIFGGILAFLPLWL